MRAAVYCRVSSDDQVKGYSLQTQEDECRQRAVTLGATEIVAYVEKGVSGDALDRPALDSLRDALRQHAIDLVVMYDPDRMARKLSIQLLLTDEITKAGAQLEFVRFDWQDTPDGRLFYAMRGAISEYEREKIMERTVRNKRAKAAAGGFINAPNTYGYHFHPDTDKLLPDERTAPIVKQIYAWARDGVRIRVIAERLANMQVPPPGGRGIWWPSTVSRILRSETYAGRMHINRWAIHKEAGRKTQAQRDRAEWVMVPVEPLVDEPTWRAVQAVLERNKRTAGGRTEYPFLLRGFLRCADCGGPMVVRTRARTNRVYGYYLCSNANGLQGYSLDGTRVNPCRHTKSVPSQVLDDAVWARIEAFLAEPDMALQPDAGSAEEAQALTQQRTILEQQAAKLEGARGRFLWALGDGLIDKERFAAEMRRVNEQATEVHRQLDAIDGQLRRRQLAEEELQDIRNTLATINPGPAETDFERKQKIIGLLVERIVVGHDPGGRVLVDVQGRVPLDGDDDGRGGGPGGGRPPKPSKPRKPRQDKASPFGETSDGAPEDEFVPRHPAGLQYRPVELALVWGEVQGFGAGQAFDRLIGLPDRTQGLIQAEQRPPVVPIAVVAERIGGPGADAGVLDLAHQGRVLLRPAPHQAEGRLRMRTGERGQHARHRGVSPRDVDHDGHGQPVAGPVVDRRGREVAKGAPRRDTQHRRLDGCACRGRQHPLQRFRDIQGHTVRPRDEAAGVAVNRGFGCGTVELFGETLQDALRVSPGHAAHINPRHPDVRPH